ncbi:hypothetical protein M8542_37140 [Amycolatopsis sp. OK19-0408]|uniref:Uncharacterized protein n=1 Tax=Amycolatopsis iheyensis TaxID=2945988 RepID=A0A9X2SN78_9PSEU|nr:hypothetical protein [Amycolatopsis iheyensis]MCR6488469.1 hypothetical protein [Amycolatopsis iheyensis]
MHFVAPAAHGPTPPVLETLCGDLLDPAVTEVLDGITGMPCVRCFACVPHAAAGPAGAARDRRRSA